MSLPMSDADIVIDYNQAKFKANQILVLAELNDTDERVIRNILRRAGCVLPKKRKYRKGS